MKVLVTGANGQLGYDVVLRLIETGHEVICTGSKKISCLSVLLVNIKYVKMDITVKEEVQNVIFNEKPDAVIHCAAWTDVDGAEDKCNYNMVWAINKGGTSYIAGICQKINCKLLYISTDYVFDGQGSLPWNEDSLDLNPRNVYGKTKLAGEQEIKKLTDRYFIVRIAWVFGINGNNFVRTMLKVGRDHGVIKVVNDQIGNPTYTRDLSKLLVDMIETEKYGCYHATNEGNYISWYDFAHEIFHQIGYSIKLIPVSTDEYGNNKAARPFNSRLGKSKLDLNGFCRLPDWKDALGRYISELREYRYF